MSTYGTEDDRSGTGLAGYAGRVRLPGALWSLRRARARDRGRHRPAPALVTSQAALRVSGKYENIAPPMSLTRES